MNLSEIKSVYFVGIGGIGMSAIARWFKQRGVKVAGYDKVRTPLTTELEHEDIWIHYEDKYQDIPKLFLEPESTLVIYTPAIPAAHGELAYYNRKKFQVKKRSEVLGIISKGHYCIAVGGTHGKTTTSSMIAHILNQTKKGCSAFIGGIMTNYETNLLVGSADAPVVVEADEFDRSFHRLSPSYGVVTSVDPDHLDIYENEENMREAFGKFLQLVSGDGNVLIHYKAAEKVNMYLENLYYTYGIDAGDYQAKALRASGSDFYFNYHGKQVIKDIKLTVPGFHNVENATAAITVALAVGVEPEVIREAIASYRGVKRRFEYHIKTDKFIYIDDYAHHPTEITAFLRSVKSMYPTKKLTVIFQPHLFTRTRDFLIGFAQSLENADEIILLDIYPAREEPIPGVTSESILGHMIKQKKMLVSKEGLIAELDQRELEVVVTVGAGDIDQFVPIIKNHFVKKLNLETV